MRVFWEKVGVLLPVYRLVGRGCSDQEIAARLGISEHSVKSCVAWIMRFLGLESRDALLRHALPVLVRPPSSARTRPFPGDNAR